MTPVEPFEARIALLEATEGPRPKDLEMERHIAHLEPPLAETLKVMNGILNMTVAAENVS